MPNTSQGLPRFSTEETLKILKYRTESAWMNRATTIESDASLTDGSGPLSFDLIAQIIMAGRKSDHPILTAQDIAAEYSRLRDEYKDDYDEMVNRLQSLVDVVRGVPMPMPNSGKGAANKRGWGGWTKSSNSAREFPRGVGRGKRGEIVMFQHRSIQTTDPKAKGQYVRPRAKK
ncbi:MAG: hypothetical protein Q9169_003513 [Polycauliona sp. 2 TL-2023]